jgi:hypothetical protein
MIEVKVSKKCEKIASASRAREYFHHIAHLVIQNSNQNFETFKFTNFKSFMFPFWVGICMGGSPNVQSFGILST